MVRTKRTAHKHVLFLFHFLLAWLGTDIIRPYITLTYAQGGHPRYLLSHVAHVPLSSASAANMLSLSRRATIALQYS